MFFVYNSTLAPSNIAWNLLENRKFCMQNNQLLTKSPVESKDNNIDCPN